MKQAMLASTLMVLLQVCPSAAREPVLGGGCEGCALAFEGMPAQLDARSRIAPAGEKGEPLIIEGTVRRVDGTPVPGIVVYAYQTDATGVYPKSTTAHGRLRGWARTDKAGRYRFDTIRPGAYPSEDNPEHVHMHVIEPGKGTYYIDDIVFEDDPLLTVERRKWFLRGRGGSGLTAPRKDERGTWRVLRDITLGKNIPGYPS